jgi:hypothetical protein
MSSTSLTRWSGLALLLAGALIAVPIVFHPSYADSQALLRPAWVPIHIALTIAAILGLFGLVGLYSRLRKRSRWLGLISFVLLFSGTALFVAVLSKDGTEVGSVRRYMHERKIDSDFLS